MKKIKTRTRNSSGIGILHDSRTDCRVLAKVCNELIDKVNELVDEVNKYDKLLNTHELLGIGTNPPATTKSPGIPKSK